MNRDRPHRMLKTTSTPPIPPMRCARNQHTAPTAAADGNVMSQATTMTSVLQQLSLSLGISIGAMVLEHTVAFTGGALGPDSFWPAFLVVATIACAALIPLRRLAPDAGHEVSGRRPIAPDPVTVMRERG